MTGSSDNMTNISVSRLKLNNFRNYQQFDISLSPFSVVITGANGSGKTNLLEAISFLVPGRGFRNARLNEIDRISAKHRTPDSGLYSTPWAVYAEIQTPNGRTSVGTGRDPSSEEDKRIVKIDGAIKRGQLELSKYFAVCYLTPQMDQIFVDGPASRRTYLDRITSSFFPDHNKHLAIYEHAKSERKKLLFSFNHDSAWLSVLEQRMTEQAVAIAATRIETTLHIQNAININENSIFPKAIISVIGSVEESLKNLPALQAEEKFRQELFYSRDLDKATGRTHYGTHRSDFAVRHSSKDMPAELCSTGEQKALLLSITIACARARKEWFGSTPVLLLDEVVAHLDKEKRAALFAELDSLSAQSWLTGTDSSFFADFAKSAQFLNIENGYIRA